MSWFLSRSKAQTDNRLIEERMLMGDRQASVQPADPALVLLATDAYGPACRRLHCFEDSEAAARFVKFWYPYRSNDSVLGFWLLGGEPLAVDKAEWEASVLIMIRDRQPGIVYAFSRPDMDAAREFLRNEAQYGLDLADVVLLWTVPVLIENDVRGDTVIFPPALPDGVAGGNPAVTALDEREMASAIALRR